MTLKIFLYLILLNGGYDIYDGDNRHIIACDPDGIYMSPSNDIEFLIKQRVRAGINYYYLSRCKTT